jgi:predicted dehydrogenase
MFSNKAVRVGVIGLGVGRWHIESYLAIPEAKVSAICDIDEEKLKSITIRYGIARAYSNYEELCRSNDIDAVSICVPNYLHTPIAICALEHGKHVLCEKPLSTTPADAEKILEVSNRFPNLKAMVAMRFRFNRDAIYIKNAIENGEMGDVYYGFISYLRQLVRIPGNWHVKRNLSGGGTLIDHGLHLLDLIWWIMGCPKPIEAFGNTYTYPAKNLAEKDIPDVEGLATAMIRFETGATIMLESAWRALIHDGSTTMRLFGTKGSAALWPFRIMLEDGRQITSRTADHTGSVPENQFKHFIQCIVNGKKPIPTIDQGVTLQKMLDAIYRSAIEHKAITI